MTPNFADIILAIIAIAVMPVVAALSARKLRRAPELFNLTRRYSVVIVRAALFSFAVLLDWAWSGRPYALLGLDVPVGKLGLIGFVLDALMLIYYGVASGRKLEGERLARWLRQRDRLRVLPRTNAEFALYPLVALVASPAEEIVYRGFLMAIVAPLAGIWPAVIISALVFGIGHIYQGWRGVARTAMIGLGFATGYALTHSLWWLMIAHAIANLFGVIYARKIIRAESLTHAGELK